MLGAEHYGMQVGEIFHGYRRTTEKNEKTNWWCYNLPPPAQKYGMVAMIDVLSSDYLPFAVPALEAHTSV